MQHTLCIAHAYETIYKWYCPLNAPQDRTDKTNQHFRIFLISKCLDMYFILAKLSNIIYSNNFCGEADYYLVIKTT